MKEALLYKKFTKDKVQCLVCAHRCFIQPGFRGICGVRENKEGKLYALNYGKAISVAIDPIEKKPFFHFLPGTFSYSFATIGCNFRCDNCQNWQISQASKPWTKFPQIPGEDLSPEEIVDEAKKSNCQSIAYTYTEPTIFLEYALETMKLAQNFGLKNVWVSNGYMSRETLEIIGPYLDAINVDLKFFDEKTYLKNCGAKLAPILENLKWLKKHKIWLEITTLSIPTLSDSVKMFQEMSQFIFEELGPETPWHISRFSPEISFKLQSLSATSREVIYEAYEIGKKAGLKYVYAGNLFGDSKENTYCQKCGKIMIERTGYEIKRFDQKGKCSNCHTSLEIID